MLGWRHGRNRAVARRPRLWPQRATALRHSRRMVGGDHHGQPSRGSCRGARPAIGKWVRQPALSLHGAVPLIRSLLLRRGPTAIAWLVMAVAIDPINAV